MPLLVLLIVDILLRVVFILIQFVPRCPASNGVRNPLFPQGVLNPTELRKIPIKSQHLPEHLPKRRTNPSILKLGDLSFSIGTIDI